MATYLYLLSVQRPGGGQQTVEVVVAAQDIAAHTTLTADMLKLEKLPAAGVHGAAAHNIADAVGKITPGPLAKDEQVLSTQLTSAGDTGANGDFAYGIPNGMRAITIAVDNITGVNGFIRAGARVDILVVYSLPGEVASGSPITAAPFMLFQNVQVLAAGDSYTDGVKGGAYTNVTLALSPNDAVKLHYFSESKLRLVLRGPQDSSTVSTIDFNFDYSSLGN